MKEKEGIKPCPCCGEYAHIESLVQADLWEYYRVSCYCCQLATKYYNTKKKAIAAWNTRVKEEDVSLYDYSTGYKAKE